MRRLIVDQVAPGLLALDAQQSHHARDVLRLQIGTQVEIFDAGGRSATAAVTALTPVVLVTVGSVIQQTAARLVVASAVPKGDRADWLVEKLSEIGVTTWVPLRTARSVVHPDGPSKYERWRRIAVEAAKQSRRVGTLEIAPLSTPLDVLKDVPPAEAALLSTGPGHQPLSRCAAGAIRLLLIGPEGGWETHEETHLCDLGLTRVSLGPTILRIETAAVVAAGIVAAKMQEIGL